MGGSKLDTVDYPAEEGGHCLCTDMEKSPGHIKQNIKKRAELWCAALPLGDSGGMRPAVY